MDELAKIRELINTESSLKIGLWIADSQKVLLEVNSQAQFTAASTIKLVVYLAYLEQIKAGKIDPATAITLKPSDYVKGAGAVYLLPEKNTWTIDELLTVMIAVSDNTATNVLIEWLGLAKIQEVAKNYPGASLERLMMKKVDERENYQTAQAAGQLLQAIFTLGAKDPRYLQPFLNQQFREGLPGLLDEADIEGLAIYNKTGRLNHMEHDVCAFSYKGKTIYLACFTEDLTNSGCGIYLLRKIGQLVFTYLAKNPDI